VNTTGNSSAILYDRQHGLSGANRSSTSIIGVPVVLPRECRCGSSKARIGSSAGFFQDAVLFCTNCNRHTGWLPGGSIEFIANVIDLFGHPSEPIIIRSSNSGRIDLDPAATATGNLRGNAATVTKGTTMKISKIYQSKYLNAADMNEEQHRFTIEGVDVEAFPEGSKPSIRLKGEDKRFVLNRTNANAIAAVYGDDTDGWIGKDIVLFPTTANDSHGKPVPAIRVTVPKPSRPAPVVMPTADKPIPF
jgi:hypothetical protein